MTDSQESQKDTPLIAHLVELRKSLLRASISLIVLFVVCCVFSRQIYDFLSLPLSKVLPENSFFITTVPFEAVMTYLKTAFFSSLFLSSPIIFWQLWNFIAPGLLNHEKKHTLIIVSFSSIFFLSGALFGYFYVFPVVFAYFTTILTGTNIVFLPQMGDYLGFSFKLLITFGLIFELPIVLALLGIMNMVTFKKLMSFQRYMIVLVFVASAILSPGPDVISQFVMALPMIALFEVGVFFVWLFEKRKK